MGRSRRRRLEEVAEDRRIRLARRPAVRAALLDDFVAHVHLKGLDRGQFCEFGSGEVDLTPVVQSLVNDGYPGSFSVEYEGPDDATVRLFEGYTRAKSLLSRLMS